MDFVTNAFAFVLVLGVMIFFHEFGHFITAKGFGIRVFIFSFGFGKRLLGFKWGETDCRLSAIPLGGYVKLEGEGDDHLSEEVPAAGDGRDFTARPRWQRVLVYLAGPLMNFVLTIAVMTGLYMVGFRVDAAIYDRPIVGAVEADSPAARAGLQPGDEILAIDGRPQKTWEDAQYNVLVRPEADVALSVRRGAETLELVVRPEASGAERVGRIGVHPLVRLGEVLPDQAGAAAGLRPDDAVLAVGGTPIQSFAELVPLVSGSAGRPLALRVWRAGAILELEVTPRETPQGARIGVTPKTVTKQFGFVGAVGEAVAWTASMTRQTFDVLGRLVTAQLSPKTMMGPLGIAQASGDAARGGLGPLVFLVAVISLQLGILNLMPLPPLDGGHLAILIGESLARRDFSDRVKGWILNTGAALLLLLIGLVLYSDLSKTELIGRFLP